MIHPEVCPMTVDRYTKALLTIIAVCLLFQTVLTLDKAVEARQPPSPYTQPGIASNAPQRVIIAGWDAAAIAKAPPLPVVVIQQREPVPVTLAQPIKLPYGPDNPLSVSIDGVRKTNAPWDTLNVHVEDRKSLPE
jgi:hypothetical protein